MEKTLVIDGNNLTISDIVAVARDGYKVSLSHAARERMARSHAWITQIVASKQPVYGINTGFGIFANQHISSQDASRLSRNLILSHAVGVGQELPVEVVRAAGLIRANTLASGYSGVRPVIAETLLEMLNHWVTPIIPSQGSLGSSGDLIPLAHLALVFTCDDIDQETDSGWAFFGEQNPIRLNGKTSMEQAGLSRLVLGPKEGLALINGATFSTAIASLAIQDAFNLLTTADIALAMTLEALLGNSSAYDERLHVLRHHPGQIRVAERIRQLTKGSTLLNQQRNIQDAYSLRCAPQVHGAILDALTHINEVISREINAVTDNPLFFSPLEAVSGGNFHGEPIALAMDYLSMALAELAAISERRIYRLTDGMLNAGLPPMLVDHPQAAGLNSGMMMLQYSAASLVLENQTLAHPDSVHSLPASAGQEDHNANSMTAARHARQILENTSHVLAIETYCAARALDLRLRQQPEAQMGAGVSVAHTNIRKIVPYASGDLLWSPEIEQVHSLINNGQLRLIVSQAIDAEDVF